MPFPTTLIQTLQAGHLAVIPTDTLYGIVCSAYAPDAVAELYRARGRTPDKPCIILIDDVSALLHFDIVLTDANTQALKKVWPGKVSVILDCPALRYAYLHRGTDTLAFRIPADEELRTLLRNTGPLLAPSANTEGQPPARTLAEAKAYFGNAVSIYVDGGYRESQPSTVVRLANGAYTVIRHGAGAL